MPLPSSASRPTAGCRPPTSGQLPRRRARPAASPRAAPRRPPRGGGAGSQCQGWAGELSPGFHRTHSSPLEGPQQSCGSGTACEAAYDRSVPVFPEHPIQGVKGAVREPPRARQKPVVLSFEAVGWCQPSLLAHLSILSHCLPGRTLCTFLTPRLGGRTLRGRIKPRLRRRTLTRAIGHGEHVLSSFQGYELGLSKCYPVTKALGHAGEIVDRR